jgi:hypothetical protein
MQLSTGGKTAGLSVRVFSRTWVHPIDLRNGIITPAVDNSPFKLSHLHMPSDPSTFWGPNLKCVAAMLWEAGSRILIVFTPYHPARIVIHAVV